jgi:hypothetical protein
MVSSAADNMMPRRSASFPGPGLGGRALARQLELYAIAQLTRSGPSDAAPGSGVARTEHAEAGWPAGRVNLGRGVDCTFARYFSDENDVAHAQMRCLRASKYQTVDGADRYKMARDAGGRWRIGEGTNIL